MQGVVPGRVGIDHLTNKMGDGSLEQGYTVLPHKGNLKILLTVPPREVIRELSLLLRENADPVTPTLRNLLVPLLPVICRNQYQGRIQRNRKEGVGGHAVG